jgi:hypothetical protein
MSEYGPDYIRGYLAGQAVAYCEMVVRGPEAGRVRLEGNWKANVKTALAKKRPKEGWPKE